MPCDSIGGCHSIDNWVHGRVCADTMMSACGQKRSFELERDNSGFGVELFNVVATVVKTFWRLVRITQSLLLVCDA